MAERPRFKKPTQGGVTDSPEALFQVLTGRAKSHGYLRGPQQDALRDYMSVHDARDVAFELPTGSGKTLVGLLVAEWQRRRSRERAAFVTLTNQLAGQVLEEANRLGIPTADLRGDKERRGRSEEGKFVDASAIGISTYSNLFNVNPILKQCNTLILDDAHGGGEFAASMWTLRVTAERYSEVCELLLAALRPLMSETQQNEIFDPNNPNRVGIVDLSLQTVARDQLTSILDQLPERAAPKYAWSRIRAHLHACHVFVTRESVTIRPYITPTFDNKHFESVSHRIYLSATLGDIEDLRRAYAIEKVEPIRAAKEQDGRRYVFAPGLGMGEEEVRSALKEIWKRLNPCRAVAITPSFLTLNRLVANLEMALGRSQFTVLKASDIEESLSPFTDGVNQFLTLANRYDGLDLPDDDCRLLILADSPRATNELEANLSSAWKLGPVLRWREATRLVQGMGRCTRNATDFAVIILMGESLLDAITNGALLRLLPDALQREIEWGRTQLKDVTTMDASAFSELVIGLINDEEYRSEAEESLQEVVVRSGAQASAKQAIAVATKEVAHCKAIWLGDYSRAQELACEISDQLSGQEWAGYRAWWYYNASIAARYAENFSAEQTLLRRAKGTGVNAGWLDHVLRVRQGSGSSIVDGNDDLPVLIAERVWSSLDELGWSGKRFFEFCYAMKRNLASTDNYKIYHQGVESLGKIVGAVSSRPNNQGDPDVVWRLGDRMWICFEAKASKLGGTGISKSDVLEAKGHVDWVRFFKTQGKTDVEIMACIIAPDAKVHSVAMPHKDSLFLVTTTEIMEWAKNVERGLTELRTKYAGQDFGSAQKNFIRDLERLGLDSGSTLSKIRATPL